jgi:hypothetical protein
MRHARLSLLLLFCSTAAFAQPIVLLRPGPYVRTDGVVHLCRPFEVIKGMDTGKTVTFSALYIFNLENSTKRTESDLDPDCEFLEENTREDLPGKTVLTRTNAERCGGVVKTEMMNRMEITPTGMRLDVTNKLGNDPGYFCTWTLDRTKDRTQRIEK